MQELYQIITLVLVIWVMAIGFGIMFRGPRGGGAVFVWPLRQALRFVRWAIGGALVALGNLIRGG